MSYHNGSVWPHDNALIAQGLARYGLTEQALQIWNGLFAAGMYFDLHRMPELFCGFPQDAGRRAGPVPGGLRPAGLVGGLGIPAPAGLPGPGDQRPAGADLLHPATLPASLGELRIHNLELAGAASICCSSVTQTTWASTCCGAKGMFRLSSMK